MSYSFISYFVLSCLRQAGLSALNCGDAAVSTFLMTEVFFSSAFLVVCFVLGCLFVCLLFVLFFQIFCFFVFQCLIFIFFYSCQNCFDVFWKHYMTLRLKSMAYKNLEVNLSTPCLNMPHHMYQPGPGSINLARGVSTCPGFVSSFFRVSCETCSVLLLILPCLFLKQMILLVPTKFQSFV